MKPGEFVRALRARHQDYAWFKRQQKATRALTSIRKKWQIDSMGIIAKADGDSVMVMPTSMGSFSAGADCLACGEVVVYGAAFHVMEEIEDEDPCAPDFSYYVFPYCQVEAIDQGKNVVWVSGSDYERRTFSNG